MPNEINTGGTRKRHFHSSSSTNSSGYQTYDGYNGRLYGLNNARESLAVSECKSDDSDGGQRKTPKHQRRIFRTKRSLWSLESIKNLPAKIISLLGGMRIVDVAFILGITFKLASVLFSWHSHQRVNRFFPTDHPHFERTFLKSNTAQPEMHHSDHKIPSNNPISMRKITAGRLNENSKQGGHSFLSKWAKEWKQQKMPFRPPILHHRGHIEYTMVDHSYIDDDDNVANMNQERTSYKGMFLSHHADEMKLSPKDLSRIGFAIVDDAVYRANENYEETQSALGEFNVYVHNPQNGEYLHDADDHDEIDAEALLAIGFNDDDGDEHERQHYIDDAEEWDTYYSFDDDFVRGTFGTGVHEKRAEAESGENLTDDLAKNENEFCSRPSFYRTHRPTCNEIHSSVSGYEWLLGEDHIARRWLNSKRLEFNKKNLSKYLGSGYYRNAFLYKRGLITSEGIEEVGEFVFKTMKQLQHKSYTDDATDGWDFDPSDHYFFIERMEDMRKDAMLMELLTSSPRAANIYSYCSMSSIIEYAPTDIESYIQPTSGYAPKWIHPQGEHSKSNDHGPVNYYIPSEEKLEIALEMAKCISVMHGFRDGVIANVDVQLGQFFRGKDGFIKIVDYNRAEPMLYDMSQERYCKFVNGQPADGMFRAPEENLDAPLDEKIDVYSLGNVFYTLLTGVMVYIDVGHSETSQLIIEGKTPIIYRYLVSQNSAEASLAKIVRWCWTHNAKDRPSIFEVVKALENLVAENRNNE
eukprot:CAMPEP_0171339140 /NCGR_PEP_ID=MMETSP0878-20121228/7762_1 /TAXON_ID=67004 /ORGANISM="Thalassiosira weissflogii, Strain CCMP1336" /LENGTH=750 /DNA_ID=CAMNT_0011841009 /DNA_START=194 /DNA_END=2446 /DNA_ORIENTATION=-